MDTSTDRRKKLSDADIKKIHKLMRDGVKGEAIMQLMGISSTHFYRIQQAYRNGEVNLKRTSLHNILHLVSAGLPFRRVAWENDFYLYYDIENSSFMRHVYMYELGEDYDMKEYSLGLDLDDLLAKDWVALTWESVK